MLPAGLLLLLASCQSVGRPDHWIGGTYVPPPGKTLLVIGQDLESVAGYVEAVPMVPGGVTTYTDISEGNQPELLYGLEEPVDFGAGPVSARVSAETYPSSALVIGLYIVDRTGSNLSHLADGTHDSAIDRLGMFIASTRRPVLLRLGYEFDGPWNHYEPDEYIAAFRHVVDRLRGEGVDNFATVWQSATSAGGTFLGLPSEAWYPGDEYVDWMGMSYFRYSEAVFERFLALARAHRKPILIAEAAPQGYDLEDLTFSNPTDGLVMEPRSADEIWSEWFGPFFRFVHDNADVIRAVAYINCDWNEQEMWLPGGTNGYWGDSRVQADSLILRRWLDEMADPFWLHGSDRLFNQLGYRP